MVAALTHVKRVEKLYEGASAETMRSLRAAGRFEVAARAASHRRAGAERAAVARRDAVDVAGGDAFAHGEGARRLDRDGAAEAHARRERGRQREHKCG